ncbi:hypothetical protein [Acidovorax sp.]|uniref:hypothetical protein n=1 Tax=Acidovorax sp. TaxID=1872122 RepID=UPI00403834C4
MQPIDAHYTPNQLAADLVEIGSRRCKRSPLIIADFAAGAGGLLDAALAKWADARIIANDAHRATSLKLRRSRPSWSVTNTNFVSQQSLRRSKLMKLQGTVDLALLNPPFSQRSKEYLQVSVGDVQVNCGLAAAFVARSLDFIKVGGTISTILPDGCLTAERDRDIWRLLRSYCDVHIEAKNRRDTFPNAYPSTSIVTLTKHETPSSTKMTLDQLDEPFEIEIVRGWKPMHLLESTHSAFERLPLIHTTSLCDGQVDIANARKVGSSTYFQGPALLMPRVGRMTEGKVCVLTSKRRVALSDCVIGIRCGSFDAAVKARYALLDAWPKVVSCYAGTGAPYTTISTVHRLLCELKIDLGL